MGKSLLLWLIFISLSVSILGALVIMGYTIAGNGVPLLLGLVTVGSLGVGVITLIVSIGLALWYGH